MSKNLKAPNVETSHMSTSFQDKGDPNWHRVASVNRNSGQKVGGIRQRIVSDENGNPVLEQRIGQVRFGLDRSVEIPKKRRRRPTIQPDQFTARRSTTIRPTTTTTTTSTEMTTTIEITTPTTTTERQLTEVELKKKQLKERLSRLTPEEQQAFFENRRKKKQQRHINKNDV